MVRSTGMTIFCSLEVWTGEFSWWFLLRQNGSRLDKMFKFCPNFMHYIV